MRPLRSFLLLLIFMACFAGLHFFLPVSQYFPSVNEFIPQGLLNILLYDTAEVKTITTKPVSSATVPVQLVSAGKQNPDTLKINSVTRAENRDSTEHFFNRFIDSLRYSKGQVRIIYYGDSQIEGDRITSYLRKSLRKKYGGTGPGLFQPLMPVMFTRSIWVSSSSNWKRYNYLSFKAGEITHRNLGPFMAICRFLPEGKKAEVPEKAFVKISPSSFADSAIAVFDKLRIFYGNVTDTVRVAVKCDGKQTYTDTLRRGKGYFEINCPLNRSKEAIIEFSGVVSPDIYGLSIESSKGVVLDNMPQRGSAGLEFTMVGRENLKAAYNKLKPNLFILQYGLNIVRNVRDDYSYYEKGLARQLALLKEVSPGTPVLVVGVTDMAENTGDTIKTYPNIPKIIEAQTKAANDEDATFWNSWKAMGGESSIVRWADRKPPMAQKDYVHFTYSGADTLSKFLAKSLFTDFREDSLKRNISVKPDTAVKAALAIVSNIEPVAGRETFLSSLAGYLFSYNPDEPMIFSTPGFWLFFLIVLAGYSLIFKKLFIRNFYLFVVSLFFYYKSGGLFLSLLLFVTLIDYTSGLLIYNSKKKFFKRLFILVSIISNLGILAYFKYTGFFVDTVNYLAGTDFKVHDYLASFSNGAFGTSFDLSNIILPVGISFFTFQSLSYTIDVYRNRLSPVRNIVDFGFYVSFFPQLVAGPIVRASEFIPQLYNEFHLSKREFGHALFLISKGLIKKIIISDFIATNFIDRIFDAPSMYSGFENLMAIYGYGLQIYCDFSGYTDIAIGLGLILGFRLPINFNSPYKASDISDFWKRWHISLSRWLKDYLYIPLGGNRKGKIRTNINLFITMLLGGLWHGASLRYIIWGALHGVGLIIHKIWSAIVGEGPAKSRFGRIIAVFITFQFVNFCWIFFRAPDMDSIKIMFGQILTSFSPGSYLTVIPAYGSVFLLIFAGYFIHFVPERIKEWYRGVFIRVPLIYQVVFLMIMAVLLFQMRSTDVMPFIYFRF
jgi:alginate O-acetyltransferase complex protein AlgI